MDITDHRQNHDVIVKNNFQHNNHQNPPKNNNDIHNGDDAAAIITISPVSKKQRKCISRSDFLRRGLLSSSSSSQQYHHHHHQQQNFKKTGTTKKKYINKKLRNTVWLTYCGENFHGMCYSCGMTKIDILNFHCGHVQSEYRNGLTVLSNLRPICTSCNLSAGTEDMRDFAIRNGFDKAKICRDHKILGKFF